MILVLFLLFFPAINIICIHTYSSLRDCCLCVVTEDFGSVGATVTYNAPVEHTREILAHVLPKIKQVPLPTLCTHQQGNALTRSEAYRGVQRRGSCVKVKPMRNMRCLINFESDCEEAYVQCCVLSMPICH